MSKTTRAAALRTAGTSKRKAPAKSRKKVSRAEAEAAVRTILEYSGEDPDREGLLETPARVVKAYDEYFSGYTQDPYQILKNRFPYQTGMI